MATLFDLLGPWDIVALLVFVVSTVGLRLMIENPPGAWPSTSILMARYRRAWMAESPRRANRMMDASLLVSQRSSTAFLASGCLLAIGGLAAVIGQAERLVDVAQDLVADTGIGRQALELKLVFLIVLLVDAFLKFIWANRVLGYCCVLLGAIPEDGTNDQIDRAVARAASVNISGGRNFNRGLRGVYYALAAMAWLLGPEAFIAAVLFTNGVILRREFFSATRRALL